MPLLPKPYPDEVVGSILLRGRIRFGLPLKAFLRWVHGVDTHRTSCSFLLDQAISKLAPLCGVTPAKLLFEHTVFPYVTAFLPPRESFRLARRLLARRDFESTSTVAMVQNVTQIVSTRRYCPECLVEDQKVLGESYWRRTHQLPTVLVCSKHRRRLIDSDIRSVITSAEESLLLPQDVDHFAVSTCGTRLGEGDLLALANMSRQLLSSRPSAHWRADYEISARMAGFVHPSGILATGALSSAVQAYFGDDVLTQMRSPMAPEMHRAWPALLLRPGCTSPTSVVKHLLLQVFLQGATKAPSAEPKVKRRSYRKKDYGLLDAIAVKRMNEQLERAKKANTRLLVKDLIEHAGIRAIYKHGSDRLPLCKELIRAFRESSQAERQLGGRDFWRKRTPSRWGLPSARVRKSSRSMDSN